MGLHLVVLGKLHLLAKSHTTTTPSVASMVVSFVLRVASNIPIIQRTCSDLIYSLRLFVFQLTRINQSQAIVDATGSRWWSRALRLVCQRVAWIRRRIELSYFQDEEALHELSMITL